MDYSPLIEHIKEKPEISPLERRILATFSVLQQEPFDLEQAEYQKFLNELNDMSYSRVVPIAGSSEAAEPVTEEELKRRLTIQLSGLVEREMESPAEWPINWRKR